jgi:hypothetical protein
MKNADPDPAACKFTASEFKTDRSAILREIITTAL